MPLVSVLVVFVVAAEVNKQGGRGRCSSRQQIKTNQNHMRILQCVRCVASRRRRWRRANINKQFNKLTHTHSHTLPHTDKKTVSCLKRRQAVGKQTKRSSAKSQSKKPKPKKKKRAEQNKARKRGRKARKAGNVGASLSVCG